MGSKVVLHSRCKVRQMGSRETAFVVIDKPVFTSKLKVKMESDSLLPASVLMFALCQEFQNVGENSQNDNINHILKHHPYLACIVYLDLIYIYFNKTYSYSTLNSLDKISNDP